MASQYLRMDDSLHRLEQGDTVEFGSYFTTATRLARYPLGLMAAHGRVMVNPSPLVPFAMAGVGQSQAGST